MPRPGWNGRRVTAAVAFVIRRDHGICHLCNHTGATSLDHLQPATLRPDLEWEPTNWAAAHLRPAGRPNGCTHPGCTCPGNLGRGIAPVTDTHRAKPSRDW